MAWVLHPKAPNTCSVPPEGKPSGVCREVLVAATVEMKMLMDEVAAVEQQLRSSLGRGDLADLVAGMQAAEKEKLRMTVSLQAGGIFAHCGPLVIQCLLV